MLQLAASHDLPEICALYQAVSAHMQSAGFGQWAWPEYPNESLLQKDLETGALYLLKEDGVILGAAAINESFDEEYRNIPWLFGVRPGSIHRLAVHPARLQQGIARKIMDAGLTLLRERGCDSLRLDTCSDNVPANRLYCSMGMRSAGDIRLRDIPLPFHCYEMPLSAECPLLPVPMTPAYRFGAATPWGGDKLRKIYGKDTPDTRTGEALEVSCIPGLESTSPTGEKLGDMVDQYGQKMTGSYTRQTFPLLLKLLDAREPLSVQVHPDDTYGKAVEGKLGKTEAWLILDAPPGSQLVYGLQPGITKEELKSACQQGSAVESLLRKVDVRPGDVCFIPAGCIHAIGAGIMLYEIQQSSDVTYRFYDYERRDAAGNLRELHIDKALDVADLHFSLDPIHTPDDQPRCRILDTTYFATEMLRPEQGEVVITLSSDFGILTCIQGALTLAWGNEQRSLAAGQTVFLPCSCPRFQLIGNGVGVLSMPNSSAK